MESLRFVCLDAVCSVGSSRGLWQYMGSIWKKRTWLSSGSNIVWIKNTVCKTYSQNSPNPEEHVQRVQTQHCVSMISVLHDSTLEDYRAWAPLVALKLRPLPEEVLVKKSNPKTGAFLSFLCLLLQKCLSTSLAISMHKEWFKERIISTYKFFYLFKYFKVTLWAPTPWLRTTVLGYVYMTTV